jgi:hypothetical protein
METSKIQRLNRHHYVVRGLNLKKNPSYVGPWDTCYVEHSDSVNLYFANGDGGNGLTTAALMRVIVDHLGQAERGGDALELAEKLLVELSR